jgi:hypothetical protein
MMKVSDIFNKDYMGFTTGSYHSDRVIDVHNNLWAHYVLYDAIRNKYFNLIHISEIITKIITKSTMAFHHEWANNIDTLLSHKRFNQVLFVAQIISASFEEKSLYIYPVHIDFMRCTLHVSWMSGVSLDSMDSINRRLK